MGGGDATAAVLALDTATDEGEDGTSESVARSLNRFCSRDGNPWY